jgi:GIY-YIG catalytic domain
MILSSINPFQLPSVLLAERYDLPEFSGVYFVIGDEEIYYIGSSLNLKRRWISNNHHRYQQLLKIQNVKISYLEVDYIDSLESVERYCIEHFQSNLNNTLVASDRIRIDVWASIRPVIETEMSHTNLTANEVVNIALADYFGLTPSGRNANKSVTAENVKPVETVETDMSDEEDYI